LLTYFPIYKGKQRCNRILGICDADFQADPPKPARIPREDVVGVTVVLLTCSYRQQEFIRVGYYVNNEYVDPEFRENPPQEPDFDQVFCLLHMSYSGT